MSRASDPAATGRGARVGVISLGCAKNLVDTEVMLGYLGRAGCRFVQDPGEADVILVNTCAFIEEAREESIRTILEAAEHKKAGRVQRLVVAGCMVQRYPAELAENLPEVDAFLDLDSLDRVVGSVRGDAAAAPLLQIGAAPDAAPARYLYDDRTPRTRATPRWSAYVKIAEGCDHTCSFCAIPSFRGTFRSRDPHSLESEVRGLVADGVREVNLVAQDSSHYGRDLGLTGGLPSLLETLDAVEGLRWLRLHYLYPNTVTDALIAAMARLPRVVRYVDIPLQHAHRETLGRMRRGGSAESHLALLERFRRGLGDPALRTTLIVGFPGETESEFRVLLEFVEAARFDHLGVFTYSHEDGTAAARLDDDVPAEVKRERRDRLMELQREIAAGRNARWLGRTVEVVVEGPHPETEHLLVARMGTQAPDVDGQVWINDGVASPGEFVRVELTEVVGYDLLGRVVGPA